MPKYICKFQDKDQDYYLEWSTIVDAPVTFGVSLDEFKNYYRQQYGNQGMAELQGRLKRVEEKGTSTLEGGSLDELIRGNRAGRNEQTYTKEQIIEWYCRKKDEKNRP